MLPHVHEGGSIVRAMLAALPELCDDVPLASGRRSLFKQYDFDQEDERDIEERTHGPSLPIVFLSAAAGIAGGVLGLYVAYIALDLSVQISAAVATLSLCAALGASGALLSALTDARSSFLNIGLSCGLVVLAVLFFGLCTMAGALIATLILTRGG